MTAREQAIQYLNQFRTCKIETHNVKLNESGMRFFFFYMYDKEMVTAKELSDAMAVSMARITALIQKLEERKLVERRISLEDARVSHIYLTEEGRIKSESLMEQSINLIMEIIEKIGVDDINHFIHTAFLMKDILEKNNSFQEEA